MIKSIERVLSFCSLEEEEQKITSNKDIARTLEDIFRMHQWLYVGNNCSIILHLNSCGDKLDSVFCIAKN